MLLHRSMKNNPMVIEPEADSLDSFLTAFDKKPPVPKEETLQNDESIAFSSSFLIEMAQFIKNTLVSINNANRLSMEKGDDLEFKKYCVRSVSHDIKKIDSILNTLLHYIHVNIPILKKNTIHLILEDILEAHEHSLQAKKIKVVRNFEENLPETFVHEEHVKFIINSILQYAILSTPRGGVIRFLTKSILQKGTGEDKIIPLKDRKSIEILIVSSDHESSLEPSENSPESPPFENEKTFGLILQLIKELVQRNQGLIEFEVDQKGSKTFFSMRLPGDRRKSVYYEPLKL